MGGRPRRRPRSCTGWVCSPSATWRTRRGDRCAAPSVRTPAAGCGSWPGGETVGGSSPRAGAQRGLAGDLRPGQRRPATSCAARCCGWRTGPPAECARPVWSGRTITLSLRFADFSELTRSATLPTATDVTEEIYVEAVALYERLGLDRARIRRVGVRVEGLVSSDRAYRQPRLTDPESRAGPRPTRQSMPCVVKFGPASVQRAVLTRGRDRNGPRQRCGEHSITRRDRFLPWVSSGYADA